MNNLYFPVCAVLINLLIVIVFFSKKRVQSEETEAYSNLIIIALFESLLACILVILMNLFGIPKYIFNIHRFDYILIAFWMWALFCYVLIVTVVNNKKLKDKVKKYTFILNIIISICFFFLKVNVINENGIIDTNGPAMNLLIFTITFYVIGIVILVSKSLFKNIKSSINKKFIPIFALIILSFISLLIRNFAPEVLLISLVAAYADLIMFFTIENPDIKMIYELNKNKKLMESMNEEKSNFLFVMSQETKKPINNILEIKKILNDEKNLDNIKTGLTVIENNAHELKNIINNVLDISNLNSSKLIVSNETYNFYNVINMCIKNTEQKINDNIELRTSISKNVPTELYGDSVKLKQIIMSILSNAVKFTNEGFIDITVNEIVKYDVCRLIIQIEDSGVGMSAQKLNELLKSSSTLEDTDMIKLNNIDVDLKLTFKIIRKLGGYINIKSEEDIGSTFTIILDQKIKTNKVIYDSRYIFDKKKVILVGNDLNLIKDINKLTEKYDVELLTTMYSNDLIQRIDNGELFDLILLEDEMKMNSGIEVLKKLKKIDGFNTNVVVILGKDKEFLENHYLEDGFNDVIRKNNLEVDYDKIIKKYI